LPITTRDRNRDTSDTKPNQIDKNHGEIVVKNPANSETANTAPPEMNSLLIVVSVSLESGIFLGPIFRNLPSTLRESTFGMIYPYPNRITLYPVL